MIYKTLTDDQKNFHLNMVSSGFKDGAWYYFPVSGIYASGEAHFYDQSQNPQTREFKGYDGYEFTIKQGSDPLTDNVGRPVRIPLIGIFGLGVYSSGEVITRYTHYAPDPSGGTGMMDKLPYNISFDPNNFLVKNSG